MLLQEGRSNGLPVGGRTFAVLNPKSVTAPATFRAATPAHLPAAARWLLAGLRQRTVVLLEGEMGAGKTTLVRAIGAVLGVVDNVASPTYGLVHEYRTAAGTPLYHFDLYRLRSPEEADAFGIFEYLDSGHLCFVEWPERLGSLLETIPDAVRLTLTVEADDSRTFFME